MIERKDRAGIRQSFINKANQERTVGELSSQSALLSQINDTQIEAFNSLLRYLDGKTTKTEVVNQLKEIGTPDILKLLPKLDKLDKSVVASKTDLKPVVDALNALKRETTLLPAKMPKPEKQNESVKVSNLSEINLDTSKVEKAIKDLKLDVKVDAPVINTEKVDLKPLQDVMFDLLKAINKQKPVETVTVKNLKDIPATDLAKVEKKLDQSNKHLKEIAEKKFGGGGGGGNGTPYVDDTGKPMNVVLTADGKIPVEGAGGSVTASGTTYKYYDDKSDATYDYLAKLGSDGSWWVNRKAIAGGPVEFAVGDSDIVTAWADPTVLTWADWDTNNQAEAAAILASDVTLPEVTEDRGQTPTLTKALNVQIGPGDPISNIPVVMEFEHHQIHEGETHRAQNVQATLGTTTVKYAVTVPDNIYPHMIIVADVYHDQGSGGAIVNIYEGATFTGGSDMTSYNRNRNSAITPGTTCKSGVTSTNGTLINSFYSSVTSVRSQAELILKKNTVYRIDVVGQKAGTGAIIGFNWYEDLNV